jgi:hypothetical protein
MKTVCAWCGAVIRDGDPPVSHGICPECRNSFFLRGGVSLQSFIDGFPFPVLVVNSSFEPVGINKSGTESSHLTVEITDTTTLGNVVECEHSRLPQGCGKTVHCSGCVLRRTLEETNETGRAAFMIPATITTNGDEHLFYVSAVRTENRVFVKLDEVDP